MKPSELASPAVVVDVARLDANLRRMQALAYGCTVELWPHIKTHKCEEIGRRQLEYGAKGFTCAKLSEAEALLGTGVRRIFLAHSLVTEPAIARLCALADSLDEITIAVTSPAHFECLEALLKKTGRRFRVALAVDSGLGREGARDAGAAADLARLIRDSSSMNLVALYSHEGHAYGQAPADMEGLVSQAHEKMMEAREAIGGELPLWPGCSATAHLMIGREAVQRIRPGAYVFGDLFLTDVTGAMDWDAIALTVEATVVDRPAPGLALIDAGSKVFSSDKSPEGFFARAQDGRHLFVTRLSEEHGFVAGEDADSLKVGERLSLVPAHVCPVVNLTDRLWARHPDGKGEAWQVTARGCVY